MDCQRYTVGHFSEVSTWYEARGVRITPDSLSHTGFIVPGIAAGFLMLTDTSACILEPFIANPEATAEERDDALNTIIAKLILEAKAMKFKRIFGFSNNPPMLKRAQEFGFKVIEIDRKTICKDI